MCGRYNLFSPMEAVAAQFAAEVRTGAFAPRYNLAPTAVVPVVCATREGRVITLHVWGLVPSWSKDARGAARLINARVETIGEKPAFRKAFASRRCLLPADGYYEWYPVPDASGGKPVKQPYFIRPSDGGLFVMAGLYEFWKAPDGSWLTTATVITTSATDEVGHLHDRMPMSVPAGNWAAWLDPDFGADARELLSVPVTGLSFYPVSTAVNKVANEGPELLEPLAG